MLQLLGLLCMCPDSIDSKLLKQMLGPKGGKHFNIEISAFQIYKYRRRWDTKTVECCGPSVSCLAPLALFSSKLFCEVGKNLKYSFLELQCYYLQNQNVLKHPGFDCWHTNHWNIAGLNICIWLNIAALIRFVLRSILLRWAIWPLGLLFLQEFLYLLSSTTLGIKNECTAAKDAGDRYVLPQSWKLTTWQNLTLL